MTDRTPCARRRSRFEIPRHSAGPAAGHGRRQGRQTAGTVSAASAGAAFSMRTRRSYQAAWPVTGIGIWRSGSRRRAPAAVRRSGGSAGSPSGGLRRHRRKVPGAGALADGVPGPDRVRPLTPSIKRACALTRPWPARQPDPVVVRRCPASSARRARHVEPIGAVDLPQPGVLRAPGVIHGHGPLGDRRAADRSSSPELSSSKGGYQMGRGSK